MASKKKWSAIKQKLSDLQEKKKALRKLIESIWRRRNDTICEITLFM